MLKMKKLSAFVATTVLAMGLTACDDKVELNTFDEQASYAVGYVAGQNFLAGMIDSQKGIVNYNQEVLLQGIKDALNKKPEMTEERLNETLKNLQTTVEKAREKAVEEANKKLVEDFEKQGGVQKTKTGILYRIEKEGEGEPITANDVVEVEYTGKLGTGEVFDSSEKNGAVEFPLNQVIAGWTEALQLLKKGGEMEMVIPSELAYGDNAMGPIPANSDLYFKVKILDVKSEK